tara:strand:+ start:750 stop:1553 length:804 start_codon:yes stop_codon:yes gene_type:complete
MNSFNPQNTSDETTSYRKSILYAYPGFGKTTQAKYFQDTYGPGFIISGEGGLSSIRSAGIDYLPFTSWNGETNPDKQQYAFKDIFDWIRTDEFAAKGYKWIMVDSLTELGDHAIKAAQESSKKRAEATNTKVNGFEAWAEYGAVMIGVCKAIRDLPMHVLVTALAKESQDEEGMNQYWPMVAGKQVQMQLPGIFDCVFCGIRTTTGNAKDGVKVERFIVTDEVRGWHGKVRDEKRRLKSVETEADLTKLFARMDMSDEDFNKFSKGN